jgi:hypothetical protein
VSVKSLVREAVWGIIVLSTWFSSGYMFFDMYINESIGAGVFALFGFAFTFLLYAGHGDLGKSNIHR